MKTAITHPEEESSRPWASWWFWCCVRDEHRWICLADNLNHLLPARFLVRRICNAHDRGIVGNVEAAMTGAESDRSAP